MKMRHGLPILLCLCLAGPAFASDHENLEEGLPAEVEDAYPISFGGREFQLATQYLNQNDPSGKNLGVFTPRFEFGLAPNWQVSVSSPLKVGDADRTGSGNVRLGALYNFNTETLDMPAFAVSARVDAPTGLNQSGWETEVKFIATKTISNTGLDRLHVNVSWIHLTDATAAERSDRYRAILGYSRRLGAQTILVADFVREQQRMAGANSNLVELGVRRQMDPLTTISIGAGAGIGEQSPNFKVTFGFQRSF